MNTGSTVTHSEDKPTAEDQEMLGSSYPTMCSQGSAPLETRRRTHQGHVQKTPSPFFQVAEG